MYNILIDGLPKEYKGYLIKYQFYNGILIEQCLQDSAGLFDSSPFGRWEKLNVALKLLFGEGVPPLDTAVKGLTWFLSCGSEEKTENVTNSRQLFSFEADHIRLYSAFRVRYGINLATENNLHWFEFLALFNDLSKTAFREVVNIRGMEPKELKSYSKEARAEILKQKKIFALEKEKAVEYTKKEQKKIDEFYKSIGGKEQNRCPNTMEKSV